MSNSLNFQIGADVGKLDRDLSKATSSISKFAKKNEESFRRVGQSLQNIGGKLSVALTLPILALGAASVKAASDAEETASKFNTVFRDISDAAQESAESLRNSYGLSRQASQALLSDTGDLLTGFGFTQSAALDLSTEVNKLAVDLASFTNFSGGAEGASKALTKALLGERESVKSLGISIQEADVQAKVLENTQKGLTFETERQAKAYATLQIAQEQSKNAIGDYERTSKSFANQTRLLKARLADVSAELGKVLLPFATKAISTFANLAEKFSNLDDRTKKIIVIVGGLVAAIGPLLFAIGSFVKLIPIAVLGLSKLTAGFVALKVAILTNPLLTLAAVIAGVVVAFAALTRRTKEVVKEQSILAQVTDTATKSIANERAELAKLLSIARDESLSKAKRLEAIRKLNELSPKYLGFLTQENINTDKARKAVEAYTEALIQNARVKAAEEKLIELQAKKIENELALLKRRNALKEQEKNLLKANADSALGAEQAEKLLANGKVLLAAETENLSNKLKEEEDILLGIIKTADDATTSFNNLNNAIAGRATQTPANAGIQTQGIDGNPNAIPEAETNIRRLGDIVTAEMVRMRQLMNDFALSLQDLVFDSVVNTFSDIGTSIGNALSQGGNVIQSIGNSLLRSMGNFLSELGGMLIEYGVMAKIKGSLDEALKAGGAVAIGAGAAAIAVGVGLKAIGASIANRANSGLNGAGASASTPNISSATSFSTNATSSNQVVFRIRGRDLVGVLENNNAQLERIG